MPSLAPTGCPFGLVGNLVICHAPKATFLGMPCLQYRHVGMPAPPCTFLISSCRQRSSPKRWPGSVQGTTSQINISSRASKFSDDTLSVEFNIYPNHTHILAAPPPPRNWKGRSLATPGPRPYQVQLVVGKQYCPSSRRLVNLHTALELRNPSIKMQNQLVLLTPAGRQLASLVNKQTNTN